MNSAAPSASLPLQIAITTGAPAGVGPELTAQALAGAAAHWPGARFTVLGDADLVAERARSVGVDWPALVADTSHIQVQPRPLGAPAVAGKLNGANGRYVLDLLDSAIDGAMAGTFDAIVTAPLQKSTINAAGVPFTGHTE